MIILVAFETSLSSNSELLEASSTLKDAKIGVLDGFAYPEFRLLRITSIKKPRKLGFLEASSKKAVI